MASKGGAVAALRQKAGKRSGNVRAVIYMPPRMLAALMTEAHRRADERGSIRTDVSAVAVGAIQQWLAKQ
jgi:hypothetical protein